MIFTSDIQDRFQFMQVKTATGDDYGFPFANLITKTLKTLPTS